MKAPLAEMGDYQSRLKSVTGGKGSYAMELAGYESAPATVRKSLIASFERPEEE